MKDELISCLHFIQEAYDIQERPVFKDYGKTLYYILKGTDDPQDWLTNLDVWQVPFHDRATVHGGFYDLFTDVYSPWKIMNSKANRIVVTGHSLGGAVATILAVALQMEFPHLDVACYSFGSPRVGNKHFSKLYASTIKTGARVVLDKDPVPLLPFWSFKHTKDKMHINEKGQTLSAFRNIWSYAVFWSGWRTDDFKDHRPASYMAALRALPLAP